MSVELNQSRDQYGQQAILVQLSNTTEGTLRVDSVTVQSTLFSGDIAGAPQGGSLELPPHQPKSVPAPLPAPSCTDPASPAPATATVSIAAAVPIGAGPDGQQEQQDQHFSVPALDPYGVLLRNNAELCLGADVAAVADLALAPTLEVAPGGRSAVVILLITPRQGPQDPAGAPGLTVRSIGGTTLLAESGVDPWPQNVDVRRGDPASTLRLGMRPARCDPHAVAEDKVGTLLPLTVSTAHRDGVLKIAAGPSLRAQLYDFVTSACRQG